MSHTTASGSIQPVGMKPTGGLRKQGLERPAASEVVHEMYKLYTEGIANLTRGYPFFNDISPLQYWAEGRRRFNVYVPVRRDQSKQWKTLYKSAMTRNKCLGVIAHVVSMMIEPSIQAQNSNQEVDITAAQFFKDMVDYTQEKEDFEVKLFWAITMAVAEGTVFLEDNYGEFKQVVKEITELGEEGLALKWKNPEEKVKFLGAFSKIVPPDQILIPNPYITDIQEQDWVIHRQRMTYDQAKTVYGNCKNWDQVIPGNSSGWSYSDSYFEQYSACAYLHANEVEVNRKWCKRDDTLDIVINGVQMTPDGNPNPRTDKQYPFAKGGYEPIDYNFFWYKALTDKVAPEQDVYDTVLRMFIDRQHIRNIPPLLTNNPALVNEEIIVPGNVTYVGNTKDSTVTTIPGFDSALDNGTVNLLQTMGQNMSESSLDPMQMGSAGSGEKPTATQAIQMAKNAQVMLGLFGWMIGYLITEWTKLRIQTILWDVSRDEDLSKITMADKILNTGKIGKRTYIFENGLAKKNHKEKLKISQKIHELEKLTGNKSEVVALDPQELANLALYVRIDAQPKPKRTDELMQSLAMEKFNVYATRPDVFNLNAAAIKLAQAWGDDPDELVQAKQTGGLQQGEMPQVPQQGQPQTPTMNQLQGGISKKMGLPQQGAPQPA